MEPLILRHGGSTGWIEVICGSMFSGKTEELIRRLRRAQIARQRVEVFKPRIDQRYSQTDVVSHDENALRSTPVDSPEQILLLAGPADVVGIDEAQFFDMTLVDVCQQLANDGKRVIVAGLDQDYMGRPFEPIPQLMAVAEYVTKLHAICAVCGAPANHSQRLTAEEGRVVLGAADRYEPRCRRCFQPPRPSPLSSKEVVPSASLYPDAQPAPPAASGTPQSER
ncbi:MAG: thymidine kinase [Rhodothermus sp.]|nr:thymidine kinase [Rhodothermus sp.]